MTHRRFLESGPPARRFEQRRKRPCAGRLFTLLSFCCLVAKVNIAEAQAPQSAGDSTTRETAAPETAGREAAAPAAPAAQAAEIPAARTADVVTRDPAAGEALFREGRRLLKAGDTTAACAKFAESQRLDPAPGTLANLADCEEQAGRTASAWVLWRRVLDETTKGDPRQNTARKRAEALEKRLARLTIRLADKAPGNLIVKRNDIVLGAASLGIALPVDPGVHVVTTSSPGHHDAQFVVEAREGEEKVLEVREGAAISVAAVAPRPIVDPDKESLRSASRNDVPNAPAPAHGRARRWVGYALTTAGIAAAGAGGVFALRARQARTDAMASCADGASPICWASAQPALDRHRRNARLADVGFATGAIAGAAGLYLVLSRGGASEAASAPSGASGLAFSAGPRPGGAEVQVPQPSESHAALNARRRPMPRAAITLSSVALALAACSLNQFEHQECTSNLQCQEALGFGAVCGGEGLCVQAKVIPRCESTFPEDLFTNPERHRDAIVLGSLMDRSSAAHVIREKATRLAVKQANAHGGLEGRRFGLVMCDIRNDSNIDDKSRTAAAVDSASFLARVLGVPALIGPSASTDVEQVWQSLRDAGAVVMSPAATSPTLSNLEGSTSTESPGLLWRSAPDDSGQGRVIAEDMLDRNVNRAIVIREVGAYGEGLASVFAERFRRGGGQLDLVSISSEEQARNAGAMTIAADNPAEVLFISSQQSWIVEYLKAASAQPTFENRTLFLTDAAANQSVLTDAGANNLYPRVRGTRPAPRDSSDYVFASFIADFRAEYQDMSPNTATFSAHAFDATWLTLYGAAASLLNEGKVTGVGISRGLRRVSSGKDVSIVAASWPGVIASFRSKQTINVRGASGDLDYHPQTRQLVSPIEIWTIAANGGQFAMVPLSVRTPRD